MQSVNKEIDWAEYLVNLDEYLVEKGFEKHEQNLKYEDFVYWKDYEGLYRIGIFVFDFSKHKSYTLKNEVMLQFECIISNTKGFCDLVVTKEIELAEFEKMSLDFYRVMFKYNQNE